MANPRAPFDEDEEHRIMSYLSVLVERLELQSWRVLLSRRPVTHDPDENPDNAQIHINTTRWVAILQLSPEWSRRSAQAKANTLTHEMLHLITRPLNASMVEWVLRMNPSSLRYMALNDLNTQEELLVDRLASLMSGTMPEWEDVDMHYRHSSVIIEDDWC